MKVQALLEDDSDRRLQFTELVKNQIQEDSTFIDSIIWTDEAKMCLNGKINRHNCYYWYTENPHNVYADEMQATGVMVWAGICYRGIIGPYFFPDGPVTGETYLSLLQDKVIPILPRFVDMETCYWRQGGAPVISAIALEIT